MCSSPCTEHCYLSIYLSIVIVLMDDSGVEEPCLGSNHVQSADDGQDF